MPERERVGLLGIQYLFDLQGGWRLGPAAVGATTGRRGGLFVWGLEAQRHWPIDERWSMSAGAFVGGGGGAAAPVGGGLMLRPHVDLWRRFDGWAAAMSAGYVRFPSGRIESAQLSLWVAIDQRFVVGPHTREREDRQVPSGFGFEEAAAHAGTYRWRRGAEGRMRFVGLRFMRPLRTAVAYTATAGIEVAGAASGDADGYAEALIVAGLHTPVAGTELGIRAGLGLAGGGGVPTGGGAIAKVSVNLRARASQRTFIDLEHGRMRRPDGSLVAAFTTVAVGVRFTQVAISEHGDARMGVSLQSYLRAQRKDGQARALTTVGLRIERSVDQRTYLTGHAHTAVAGGAGAFGVGLVGLGRRSELTPDWALGGEVLVGAAGGGGVAVRGGAVAQAVLWARRRLSDRHHLQLAAGRLHAFKGALSSPVIEAGLTTAF